jgi:hypothetical protein
METRSDFRRIILINKKYYDAYIKKYRTACWDWKSIAYNPPIYRVGDSRNITWEIIQSHHDTSWNYVSSAVNTKKVYNKPIPEKKYPKTNKYNKGRQ